MEKIFSREGNYGRFMEIYKSDNQDCTICSVLGKQ